MTPSQVSSTRSRPSGRRTPVGLSPSGLLCPSTYSYNNRCRVTTGCERAVRKGALGRPLTRGRLDPRADYPLRRAPPAADSNASLESIPPNRCPPRARGPNFLVHPLAKACPAPDVEDGLARLQPRAGTYILPLLDACRACLSRLDSAARSSLRPNCRVLRSIGGVTSFS